MLTLPPKSDLRIQLGTAFKSIENFTDFLNEKEGSIANEIQYLGDSIRRRMEDSIAFEVLGGYIAAVDNGLVGVIKTSKDSNLSEVNNTIKRFSTVIDRIHNAVIPHIARTWSGVDLRFTLEKNDSIFFTKTLSPSPKKTPLHELLERFDNKFSHSMSFVANLDDKILCFTELKAVPPTETFSFNFIEPKGTNLVSTYEHIISKRYYEMALNIVTYASPSE
ncbi:hypothetical protein RVX_R18120 [Nitratidesulfovibrio sp. HK-II]|uniref:hypothetical protein n=1 Tax=Nitratidesulfovibrio sp. HK-II TaxID=2009266 RepID=UPI0002275C75|nr:hypothetical protein [Nitratidesulfovibrio sp. HK-II]EGY27444.1 hypothetical protein DA2_0175 [Desulfovibrio sp. A2]